MKHLFILTAMLIASFSAAMADDTPVVITTDKTNPGSNPSQFDRAPMHINIDVWFDSDTNTFTVSYDGEATGEVTVYRNGDIVASDTEINTVLTVDGTPGLYTIEIVTDSSTATGSLEL